MSEAPSGLPLKITTLPNGTPSVTLGGIELGCVLAAEGLKIRYVTAYGQSEPEVTMIFGPGALELDFDVNLLRLLAEKHAPKRADDA